MYTSRVQGALAKKIQMHKKESRVDPMTPKAGARSGLTWETRTSDVEGIAGQALSLSASWEARVTSCNPHHSGGRKGVGTVFSTLQLREG